MERRIAALKSWAKNLCDSAGDNRGVLIVGAIGAAATCMAICTVKSNILGLSIELSKSYFDAYNPILGTIFFFSLSLFPQAFWNGRSATITNVKPREKSSATATFRTPQRYRSLERVPREDMITIVGTCSCGHVR